MKFLNQSSQLVNPKMSLIYIRKILKCRGMTNFFLHCSWEHHSTEAASQKQIPLGHHWILFRGHQTLGIVLSEIWPEFVEHISFDQGLTSCSYHMGAGKP